MGRIRANAVAIVSILALGGFAAIALPAATADDPTSATCAKQQSQVDKATAKSAELTEKFAAHPNQDKKSKKAQVQRLAHATARLDACLAAAAG